MHFKRQTLNDFIQRHAPTTPNLETITKFKKHIEAFLATLIEEESEEFQKNQINKFFLDALGYTCNTKGRIDLAIYIDDAVEVLLEVKSLTNTSEFPSSPDSPLSKAFCESVLYFLREFKREKNNTLKHIILCNAREYFVFDAREFLLFDQDSHIQKLYKNCDEKQGIDTKTAIFYKDLHHYLETSFAKEISYTYFKLSPDLSLKDLSLIFQLLSPQVLLKRKKTIDANTLNRGFYEELLYILGLSEKNEGGKVIITPSGTQGSLYDATLKQYSDLGFEEIFSLLTTWNNRILFLRLLESMLLSFKHLDSAFLSFDRIKDFPTLNTLFFEVLAKREESRLLTLPKAFWNIPYLNSSLFDKTPLEMQGKEIKLLESHPLAIHPKSILKKSKVYEGKEKALPLLEYWFAFLHAYDFTTTPEDLQDGIKQNHDLLINSAVLGLVFEKLNGYKEGSFYTPSFITSYMCKESITQAVIEKFNATYAWKCENLQDLRLQIDRGYSQEKQDSYFQTLLSLRICDPAVGSGHFLVSALNEMIFIAYTLGLIPSLLRASLTLENDEILIRTFDGNAFAYTMPTFSRDPNHQIQEELFKLKRSLIENCLFGVDINPNSCEITRLRLWIELLKTSYYLFDALGENTRRLQTLPNIDINIKCGNTLIQHFPLDSKLTIGQTQNFTANLKAQIQSYKDSVESYKSGLGEKRKILHQITGLKSLILSYLEENLPATSSLKTTLREFIFDYGDAVFDIDTDFGLAMLRLSRENHYRFNPTLTAPEPKPIDTNADKLLNRLKSLYEEILSIRNSSGFEWRFEFPEVLDSEGNFLGFDCVIGNPPYIRIQGLDKETSKQYKKNFKTATKNYDIYVLFVENCLKLLAPNAQIAFIMPHKWFNSEFGVELRQLTKDKINKIISFGDFQIFNASTYTALQWFSKKSQKVAFIQNPQTIQTTQEIQDFLFNLTARDFLSIDNDSLSASSWYFGKDSQQKIFRKIMQFTPMKEIFRIFVGLQTSKDSVYFFKDCKEQGKITLGFSDELQKVVEVETALLKPLLMGDSFHRYETLQSHLKVLFPYYENVDSKGEVKMSLYDETTLQKQFPKGYAYLKECEEVLRGREKGRFNNDKWYQFGRAQGIAQGNIEKILCPDICDNMHFSLDSCGEFYFTTTIYGYIKNQIFQSLDYNYLIAILNSKLVWWFISKVSAVMRGGFYRIKPAYIQDFCIPNLSTQEQKPFIDLGVKILKAKEKDKNADTKELESQIDSLVYTLYNLTEEEIAIIEGEK